MFCQIRRLIPCLACLWLMPLAAQEARVRTVSRIDMPTQVDSNSPAFWRDGKLFWFGSHGRPWLSEGKDLFGPWVTREISLETPNAWPHWMESVWPEDNGVLWGWYHAEPIGLISESTMTAPRIGAVVSFDGGNTLRDLGIVLESGEPLDPTAQNGYFAGGHGDFSVILDRERRFFYFFFDNYGGPAATQGVCLARMALEDRNNPAGKVWKYCDGQWQEAGLGGRVKPIFPVARRWQAPDPDAFWGPSVHWNTHLNCYVMLLNRAQGEPGWSQEGVYVSFSDDLSRPDSWTTPRKILDKAEFPGWYFFYPQVMGLEAGGTDRRAGATARLFVGGISKWEIDFIAPPRAPSSILVSSDAPTGTVTAGQGTVLSASATGTSPLTYQWYKDGVALPQATSATYVIPTVTAGHAGIYSVQVGNDLGSAESNRLTLAVAVPPPESYITNLAVRSLLPSPQTVLTLGLVVQSAAPKALLVRAVGPTLGLFGVTGAVADPSLEVFDAAAASTARNDDWQPEQASAFAAVGAFSLPEGSADAALRVETAPGPCTVQVRGLAAGVVLAEVYDPEPTAKSKVVNLSARGVVGSGEGVLIGGFGLNGKGTKRLLLRALGPQLAAFGVSGALADPVLQLVAADGTVLATNDNWESSLASSFATAGAAALPEGSRDAAIVVSLAAGAHYTVTIRSADDSEGEALLEIYELP